MARNDRSVLPDNLKPTHYDISLFDMKYEAPWSYKGLVKIDAKVLKSTKEVVVNIKKLEIQHALVEVQGKTISETTNVSYNDHDQRVTLSFPDSLPAADATVVISFTGTINADMCGFYRSKYKADAEPAAMTAKDTDGYHYMFSTQFEACDARQAFPCFDEPNLKATYSITLEVPEDQVAISNMPVKSTTQGKIPGMKVVSFERTPPMSSYLAAWAIGDFEYIETFTQRKYNGSPVPVRVYATRGLQHQGKFALEHAHKIVDLFSETFGIDYPIPKADLLAVHDFAQGAMENWGLVTYRAIDVLYDPDKSDTSRQNRIAYVVAHELAHQWFGNLVTMDWWDELWLNESFATWVGWWAVDQLHPEWKVWDQFLSETAAAAFGLDSLRTSHPIQVPVKDALDVDQIFDAISYSKGSAVLRMLADFAGQESFFKGVGMYLQKHAYGNATTNDLWAALSNASGTDVTLFIDPWIRKIGFPYLTVAEEPGQIGIKQGRFLAKGDVKPEEDETIWSVPLNLRSGLNSQSPINKTLTTKEETIRDIDDEFYLLNAGQKGFFRTNYPPPRLTKLGRAQDQLSISDKIGLVNDASSMAYPGFGTTAGLLALLEGFQHETNYMTWSAIATAIGRCKYVFSHNERILNGLRQFTLKLVTPAVEKVGFNFDPNEDYLTTMLRKLLLAAAANSGHKEVIAEAQRLFAKWQSGDEKAFSPNARAFVFSNAVAHGGQAEWDALKHEYLTTSDLGSKVSSLQALGRTKDHNQAWTYLEMVLTDDVKPQNMPSVVSSVGSNNDTRHVLWEFTQNSWDKIYGRFGQNKVTFEKWFTFGFRQFSEPGMTKEMEEFLSDKDIRGIDRSVSVACDLTDANAKYRQRDEKLVLEWLEAHGYV